MILRKSQLINKKLQSPEVFYKHSTYVSDRQRKQQTQFRFIVKKELVAAYGNCEPSVVGAKTRKVQLHPSSFSTLKTFEHPVPVHSVLSFSIGKLKASPLHKYNCTGLVLHVKELVPQPRKPRSHVSKHVSELQAFCCNTFMMASISAICAQESVSLLHILIHTF